MTTKVNSIHLKGDITPGPWGSNLTIILMIARQLALRGGWIFDASLS